MEQNTVISSSSPSSSENVETKPSSLISAIAGTLSEAVHGVIQSAASTIQQGLHLNSSFQADVEDASTSSDSSTSPSLEEKAEHAKDIALDQGKEILSSASEKVSDVVDSVKASVASAVELAEEKIIRPPMAVAKASGALDKAAALFANMSISTELNQKEGENDDDKKEQPVKEEGKTMSYSEYALEQFSRGGCTEKKLTMEMVAHIQRIADRTNDTVLHDMARKAHSAFAKGIHEAPGVHLTWITVEQANELVNLAIRTQDRALADFARYCQSVAATTQLGVEPFPGKIRQELEKGRADLAQQGRTHSGPGYGAAFSTVPRPQQQAGMTKSISATAIATTKPASISPSPSQQQIKPTVSTNNNNQQGMMKSYSTSNVQRTERYGFGPSPSSISPPASGNTSPTSASAPTRASFGTAPAGLTPKVYAPPAPVAPQPQPQQQQQQQMQKSASAYYVPPSKAAAIANGYVPLSQRTPGMMMGSMMKSASSARADISSAAPSNKDNNSNKDKPVEAPVVKKSMIKSFSTNTAAMPSVSTPIATDLKLTMDMVAHLQRIADRTGDSILHDTARKAHSACAKGLNEAPGVHLTKITPEQANELVNLAIRTQDHGLADFARYCQSVAATTQLGIEPSPGKIGQELAKGRAELAQQGRSYTGPGYGAAFASLNKSASGRDVSLKPSSPKADSAPVSPLSPPSSEAADTHDAQGQIKADAVKAEPFVPQVLSQSLAQ